jgi:hypothetical protein
MLLLFLFAIVHVADGAIVRGSTTSTATNVDDVQELHEATAAAPEPRKLKGGMKGGKNGGGTTVGGGTTQPVNPPRPVVECEGCCCSLRDGVTKCCGKTCANGMLCL